MCNDSGTKDQPGVLEGDPGWSHHPQEVSRMASDSVTQSVTGVNGCADPGRPGSGEAEVGAPGARGPRPSRHQGPAWGERQGH